MNVLIYVAYIFYNAFVFWCGWEWFVTPLGVPSINLFHGIGLFLLSRFFVKINSSDDAIDIDVRFIYVSVFLILMYGASLYI